MKDILFTFLLTLSGCAGSLSDFLDPRFTAQDPCGFAQDTYGERVHWNRQKLPIQIYIHESVPRSYIPAIQAAMKDWEDATGRPLFQIKEDNAQGPVLIRQDGFNTIYYVTDAWKDPTSEQAFTRFWGTMQDLLEADIAINGKDFKYTTETPANPKTAVHLETLMVHELGHFLGLKHLEDPKSVMYPYITSGSVNVRAQGIDLKDVTCVY